MRRPSGQLLLVPADAGEAALPRQRLRAARVEVEVQQVGVEVRHVRDVGVVELLRVAEADPAADHPVGEADGVGADVLAERELVLDLAVVGVVVVDVDLVVDLDAGLVGEAHRASGSCRRRPRRCRRPSSPRSGSCRWPSCRRPAWAWPLRPVAQAASASAVAPAPAPASSVRRVSCARRAWATRERIIGSWGRGRAVTGTPFGLQARAGGWVDTATLGVRISRDHVRIVNFCEHPMRIQCPIGDS